MGLKNERLPNIIITKRIIVYNYSMREGNVMEKYISKDQWNVETCKRCGDEKKVNRFGVCDSCDHEIDNDYAGLYGYKEMEN